MGCCVSNEETKENTDTEPLAKSRPKYSWEREKRPDRTQLIISGQVGGVVGRLPGQLKGGQMVIQECKECEVFVLDQSSSLTVHGCTDCSLVLGPCAGSVYMRECERCTVVVASQQFRVRDCRKCTIYLHCKSQPVIESSQKLLFSCFQAYYHHLRDQFTAAGLHPFHNQWSQIHNFTNHDGESGWSFAQETTPPIKLPSEGDLSGCGLTFQRVQSTVPFSVGPNARPAQSEGCVVVVTGDEREETATLLLSQLPHQVQLVQTSLTHFKQNDGESFFGDHQKLLETLRTGPCIVMELVADESCHQICCSALTGIIPEQSYYISSDPEEAEKERQSLNNYLMSSLNM